MCFGFFKKKKKQDTEVKQEPEVIGPWCKLNNDYQVPRISLNLDRVYKTEMLNYVTKALELGYRMFDFDADNQGLEEIQQAIQNSGINRKQVFYAVSFKCPDAPSKVDKVVKEALGRLQTDYIDIGVFKANGFVGIIMELYYYFYKIYQEKKMFKAFGIEGLDTMREDIFNLYRSEKIQLEKIACNLLQPNYVLFSKYERTNIKLMAKESLGTGENLVNYCKVHLEKMTEETGKTISQLALRFLYQRGNIVTVQTNSYEELAEFIDINNFTLTEEQMKYLSEVDNY